MSGGKCSMKEMFWGEKENDGGGGGGVNSLVPRLDANQLHIYVILVTCYQLAVTYVESCIFY